LTIANGVSRVSIVRRDKGEESRGDTSVDKAVRKAAEPIGGVTSFVKPGDRVVIEPNLAYPYSPPATTDPSVAGAVAKLCVETGAREVLVGESSSCSCKNTLCIGEWPNLGVIRQWGSSRTRWRPSGSPALRVSGPLPSTPSGPSGSGR
jgi:hypothetical protein